MTVDCMREQLLEGKKIRLGDLGDFSILLSSKGAEDADKFSAQNITDVKVQWEPGAEFKNLIADAEFNLNGKVLNYQIQKKLIVSRQPIFY